MRNFQGVVFIRTQTYSEIFRSVPLKEHVDIFNDTLIEYIPSKCD